MWTIQSLRLASFIQCARFPGIILVFEPNLIVFEWYWYVVSESGIWYF